MESKEHYPYEFKDLNPEESAEVFRHFHGYQDGFMRVGPKGYFFMNGYKDDAPNLYKMPLRADDVFVVTFPKAGTTWAQELVWMVANNFDYETSNSVILPQRFPFLDMPMILNSNKARMEMRAHCNGDPRRLGMLDALSQPGSEMANELPSPRFLKTHLPLTMLPPSLLDTAKVVYVVRDPRDIAVSYYHHNQLFKLMGYTGDFKSFWNYFIKDMVDSGPYFHHVFEAWAQRDHPNMLFLFYEDMLKDLPLAVRRMADFLGKEVSEEQMTKLCDHLSFHNFKNNKSVNFEFARELGWLKNDCIFMRKGVAGNWRDYFDEEMAAQAQSWIEQNLRGTGLRMPSL